MSIVTFKNNRITIYGDFITLGSKAPDFRLANASLDDVQLSDYEGKRKILNIVPSLDTATCQVSTREFNKRASAYANTVILVISADLPFAQNRFCKAENLDNVIPLSMMRNRDFARDYRVLITDGPLKGITTRAVIVLDEHNKVIHAQLVADISSEPDYDAVLAVLA
ncbi:lipid hydroperoxide peroxidase [Gammaproteobacteria bacterium]|nr:lipid hydroperoxide peroxidase [Gammaproteobacteria bacterium]